jgi:hypothetical protein
MKIDVNKNIEIVIHSGIMKVYVDGEYVDVTDVNAVHGNAAFILGNLVGILRREGVIID